MRFGFNTNVHVGDAVYHVQTEDHGLAHPVVDTVVYDNGRIVHRRATSYQDMLDAGGLTAAALEQRVLQQHRGVVEELRAGALKLEQAGKPATGIRLRLLNPTSWLRAGQATLEIAVHLRTNGGPVEGAAVEVALEGSPSGPFRFPARTDPQGRATFRFALPRLDPATAALVIRADDAAGRDELRFRLRPKPRASAPQTTAQ